MKGPYNCFSNTLNSLLMIDFTLWYEYKWVGSMTAQAISAEVEKVLKNSTQVNVLYFDEILLKYK